METSQPQGPFLSLLDATFRLGDRLVFEKTSWMFRRHEHWAIIGANGAGKSLLADALRGRVPLVQGEMRYHFRPPDGLSPEEAIGHVSFEDRKANVRDTVVQSRWNSLGEESTLQVNNFLSYERVMEINPFEISDQRERARSQFERHRRRAVALLRIEPFLDRTLISLSNGETQRVLLARALCHPMRLLILDEPFAGLDAASRGSFRRVLEQLMRTSLRVLLITTRLEDLPRHLTHVLRVDGCRMVAAGPRRQVLQTCDTPVSITCTERRKGLADGRSVGTSSRRSETAGSAALVQLRHITVRYGKTTILRDVDWTVRPGESWALLGPNGSGKTTLLSLILGDNPQAYANEVTIFGKPRAAGQSVWAIRKRIGWVSPELHVYFSDAATCLEVVASGLHGTIGLFERLTPHQRSVARQSLARFELLDFAGTPLFALSAGLQRLVLLARAVVRNPRLLILDEPCQGLDLDHRIAFVRMVDSLIRARSVTVIYVTHHSDEIPGSIRRVLKLVRGRAVLDRR